MGTNISVIKISLSRTSEKKVKKGYRDKILCKTTLLFEFDDETNHFLQ